MTVLERIRSTLRGMCDGRVKMHDVYYGACNERNIAKWNYFVFNRQKTSKDQGSRAGDYQTFYEIHVVHEDYIPEGFVEQVIAALEEPVDEPGTKLKATSDDVVYNYTFKGHTDTVVEIATITVFHPEKRC